MAFPLNESEQLNSIIGRVLDMSEFTWGTAQQNFVVRYRGRLRKDSAEAYDELAEKLLPYDLTPLFREEEGQHAVILMKGVHKPNPSNGRNNVILFVLTLISMLLAGAIYAYEGTPPTDTLALMRELFSNLGTGVSFALSLLAILLAHEFGHYFAARYHKTAVTLPYFLPFPFSPFGTLGAFIQLKQPPKNKRILHDIGIAGPLAGLIVAIPVLLVGLSLSKVETIPTFVSAGEGFQFEGNSLLYLLSKYIVHGELLPAPRSYGDMNPVLYWVRYLFSGLPTPLGGRDVILHPMAWAGWAGLLVTALNLIPVGQLDGGHVLYTLLGKRVERVLPFILVSLVVLGLAWSGWWLWAFLIFSLARSHAEPLDQITPLDGKRKALALLGLLVFVMVFTPVPLRLVLGPYVGP